jgi:hypothetical protein
MLGLVEHRSREKLCTALGKVRDKRRGLYIAIREGCDFGVGSQQEKSTERRSTDRAVRNADLDNLSMLCLTQRIGSSKLVEIVNHLY